MAEKYVVIADKLEIELKKMRSEGRMKLPSENSLSEQFSCSRQTGRAALDILKKAGLIEKRNGSGSYIVEESKKNKLAVGQKVIINDKKEINPMNFFILYDY